MQFIYVGFFVGGGGGFISLLLKTEIIYIFMWTILRWLVRIIIN